MMAVVLGAAGSTLSGTIPRDDPLLVEVVRGMGAAAYSAFSKLQIVAIPSDVTWEILDYDGVERVVEKHRSWSSGSEGRQMITLQRATPEMADYLPRLPARMLWETNKWDGPMAGYAECDGEFLYFTYADALDSRDDIPEPHYRRFWLVRVSDKERADAETRHRCFQEHVGTHCDHEDLYGFHMGERRPREMCHLFYDKYPPGSGPTYMASEIVGWFDW